jgi:exodeoxyribonuclease VII small subunit
MTETPKKNVSFAKAYEELESITEEFERGDVDLEEGLKKFARGLELAKQLKGQLKVIEQKVEEIKKKFNAEE